MEIANQDNQPMGYNERGELVPMMLIRMRCPSCKFDMRFLVQIDTPLEHLPEITKQVARCACRNHIPKIGKRTPIEESLMSINGVPLRVLKKKQQKMGVGNG